MIPHIRQVLEANLSGAALAWWREAGPRVKAGGAVALGVAFPQLPRRLGREAVSTGVHTVGGMTIDIAVWRRCDMAAAVLLDAARADDATLLDLVLHGDLEERAMALRALATRPITAATTKLMGEIQRSNVLPHFEAAVCDSNLLVRAAAAGALAVGEFERIVLKLAFNDLAAARVIGLEERANAELSRMLQGLATEREAATRKVWHDTNRLIARAPTLGTLARLAGALEHGDDAHRRAAAEGLAANPMPELAPFLHARILREPVPAIRTLMGQALG